MRHALLCLFLFSLRSSLFAADKPDALVVIADQWNPRYVGWDNKKVRTPQLDQIAKEGMIFDACYVTSRVSLLTGLYTHNPGHEIWGNASGYCRHGAKRAHSPDRSERDAREAAHPLRSTQMNRAAGYIPKIQRLREAEKEQLRLAGEAADSQPFD